MRTLLLLFTFALLIAFFNGVAAQSTVADEPVERQIIVMFTSDVVQLSSPYVEADISETVMPLAVKTILAAAQTSEIKRGFPNFVRADTTRLLPDGNLYKVPDRSNLFVITVAPGIDRGRLIAQLERLPYVRYAEKNQLAQHRGSVVDRERLGLSHSPRTTRFADSKLISEVIPTDAYFDQQWGLYNTIGPDIEATKAWTITKGNSSQIVGVVDGPVEEQHSDLAGRVSGEGTSLPPDDHGTHVTGIAAAEGNGGGKVAGVNWNAQVVHEPLGNLVETAQSIDDVVMAGAKIINNSWGFANESATLTNALISAAQADVLLIHANPYQDGPPAKTSNYPNDIGPWILNVGAMEQNGDEYFNTGGRDFTDVAGPGVQILSTIPSNDYGNKTGTSMAAPFVTGAASLLLAVNSNLYSFDIEHVLKETAQGDVYSPELGYGMIDAYAALQYAVDPYTVTHGEADFHIFKEDWEVTFTESPDGELAAGAYVADLYKMEVSVDIDYENSPLAWLGITAPGLSGANPNDADPFMLKSVSPTSFSSSTFFYLIETAKGSGQTINEWVPYDPTVYIRNGKYVYTIIGIPSLNVSISGPSGLRYEESGTWTANTSVDDGVSYQWYIRDALDIWINTDVTTPTYSRSMHNFDFDLKAVVERGAQSAYDIHHVNYEGGYDGGTCNMMSTSTGGAETNGEDCPPWAVAKEEVVPDAFALEGAAPNPVSDQTTIRYALPEETAVRMAVFDVLGRRVRMLVDETLQAGYHHATFDPGDLSSGIYFVRMHAGEFASTKQVIVMR